MPLFIDRRIPFHESLPLAINLLRSCIFILYPFVFFLSIRVDFSLMNHEPEGFIVLPSNRPQIPFRTYEPKQGIASGSQLCRIHRELATVQLEAERRCSNTAASAAHVDRQQPLLATSASVLKQWESRITTPRGSEGSRRKAFRIKRRNRTELEQPKEDMTKKIQALAGRCARFRSRIRKRSLETHTFPAFIIIAQAFLFGRRSIFGTLASFATEYSFFMCLCVCIGLCTHTQTHSHIKSIHTHAHAHTCVHLTAQW